MSRIILGIDPGTTVLGYGIILVEGNKLSMLSAGVVKLIAEAKKKGLDVTASVAVHNLRLTDTELETFDTNFKVNPPLRTKKDSKALVKALLNGTIDFVTTDHRPMDIEEKRVEFDNAAYGSIGLESAFGALNYLLNLDETITLLTKGRERFGISVPKIEEGSKANLTLFNPDGTTIFSEEQVLSKSKNAIFFNKEVKGTVYGVINNDKMSVNG